MGMWWMFALGLLAGWSGHFVYGDVSRRIKGRREYQKWKADQDAVRKWGGR